MAKKRAAKKRKKATHPREVLASLKTKASGYYIKDALWAFADAEIQGRYLRARTVHPATEEDTGI